jgi:hypothetical protein
MQYAHFSSPTFVSKTCNGNVPYIIFNFPEIILQSRRLFLHYYVEFLRNTKRTVHRIVADLKTLYDNCFLRNWMEGVGDKCLNTQRAVSVVNGLQLYHKHPVNYTHSRAVLVKVLVHSAGQDILVSRFYGTKMFTFVVTWEAFHAPSPARWVQSAHFTPVSLRHIWIVNS